MSNLVYTGNFLLITTLWLSLVVSGTRSCDCPQNSCRRITNFKRRCECCIYEFLGKRSGPPAKSMETHMTEMSKRQMFIPQEPMASFDYPFFKYMNQKSQHEDEDDVNTNINFPSGFSDGDSSDYKSKPENENWYNSVLLRLFPVSSEKLSSLSPSNRK